MTFFFYVDLSVTNRNNSTNRLREHYNFGSKPFLNHRQNLRTTLVFVTVLQHLLAFLFRGVSALL